jgi:hypothetical protein
LDADGLEKILVDETSQKSYKPKTKLNSEKKTQNRKQIRRIRRVAAGQS